MFFYLFSFIYAQILLVVLNKRFFFNELVEILECLTNELETNKIFK